MCQDALYLPWLNIRQRKRIRYLDRTLRNATRQCLLSRLHCHLRPTHTTRLMLSHAIRNVRGSVRISNTFAVRLTRSRQYTWTSPCRVVRVIIYTYTGCNIVEKGPASSTVSTTVILHKASRVTSSQDIGSAVHLPPSGCSSRVH